MKNKNGKTLESYLLATGCCALLIAADQLTKRLASVKLKGHAPFVIWKGVFTLEYLENRGAAFGIMQGRQTVFLVIAVIILFVIGILYGKMPHTKRFYLLRICAVLVCAGAAGNMADRIRMNYVIDFFYFELIDFPVFNVADCYVVVASILFVLTVLFYNTGEELKCFSFKKE